MQFHGCTRYDANHLVLVAVFGGDPAWQLRSLASRNATELASRLQSFVDHLTLIRREVVIAMNEIPQCTSRPTPQN